MPHLPSTLGRLAATLLLALAPALAGAAEVLVVGTPHLAGLDPAPATDQPARVVARLATWAPTRVCVEAVPGERVEAFLADPATYGEVLTTFAPDAVRLGAEMQARLGLSAAQARREAATLAAGPAADEAGRLRLLSLQLAAHDPWSAALNWASLPDDRRERAQGKLPEATIARLEALVASRNEIAAIAIPLAKARGLRELCAVDPFADELAVNALADELMPMLSGPGVAKGLAALEEAIARQWRAGDADGLARLLAWMNGDEYARLDFEAEWQVFAGGSGHHAGQRRLMLWHARNGEIAARLAREMARADGGRVLLLVGAAHGPFLRRSLATLPWVTVADAAGVLAP